MVAKSGSLPVATPVEGDLDMGEVSMGHLNAFAVLMQMRQLIIFSFAALGQPSFGNGQP